jgi:hypothetical protein
MPLAYRRHVLTSRVAEYPDPPAVIVELVGCSREQDTT